MTRNRHRPRLEALQAGGVVVEDVVEDVAERFGVPASTIRRDLQRLATESAIRRVCGGAVIAHPLPEIAGRSASAGPARDGRIARAARALLTTSRRCRSVGAAPDPGEASTPGRFRTGSPGPHAPASHGPGSAPASPEPNLGDHPRPRILTHIEI